MSVRKWSRKLTPILAAVLLVPALVLTGAPAAQAAAAQLVAAPDGQGSDCTREAPCDLAGAQLKARELVGSGSAVTVTLLAGRYDLSQTLRFSARDSGTPEHPVVWRAADPDAVVISGGTSLTGWTQYDAARGIWVADVPVGSRSRQLYVDGAWAPVAQATARELGFPTSWSGTSTGYRVTDATSRRWLDALRPEEVGQVEFVYTGKTGPWTQSRCPLSSVTAGESATTVTMLKTCWDGMTKRPPRAPIESGGLPNMSTSTVPTYVANHYSLLSAGEWYLDSAAGRLYYAPQPGVDIHDLDITLPRLERLVTVSGTLAEPVHDLSFEGLQFSYATWLGPSVTGFAEVQSNLHITGAPNQGKCTVTVPAGTCPYGALSQPLGNVDVTASRNVRFVGNTFRALGGAGLSVRYGAHGTVIEGNHITDTSGTGLFLGCTYDPQPWDPSTHDGIKQNCTPDPAAVAGDRIGRDEAVSDTLVANNVVHAVGRDYKAAPGITVLFGRDLRMVHNQVYDTPYTGITAGVVQGHATDADNPSNNPNVNARNEISDNLIHDYMQELRDGGAIYVEGHQAEYVHAADGTLDVEATRANGFVASGNVAFNDRPDTNYTYYDDAGSQFITWDANVAFRTAGASQGGCSPAGYLWTIDNYFAQRVGRYACSPPALAVTAENNTAIPASPTLDDVPEAILAGAGLEPAYSTLSKVGPRVLRYQSPRLADGTVLLAATGLRDQTKIYAGRTELDRRRIGSTFVEVVVPDSLASQPISVGVPAHPQQTTRVNETDPSVTSSGWSRSASRGLGDFQDDLLFTRTDGATVSFAFTGNRVRIHGEKNSDQAAVAIAIDDQDPVTVDTASPTRVADAVVYESPRLGDGPHTVTITKLSGTYATFDGYEYVYRW
ncbi:hypothetical protein [Streptomyces sp. NPDC001292]|uniref:hypothetical protein n=1 Tax=Streptomyces sp. NPDC001292 TaxID=3364558 RepID=UPI0036B1D926